jgi:hypothetical protein
MPPSRVTLQHLVPPNGLYPVPAIDAQFADGVQVSSPPAILLDYMYGAAAYQRWGTGVSMDGLMQQRFSEYYKPIPLPPPSPSSSDGDGDGAPRRRHQSRSDMTPELLQAMDNILRLSMWLKGTTPEAMAAERERRKEEEELRARKAGRVKVLEWLQSDAMPANTKCLTQVNEALTSHVMYAASSPQDME